MKKIKWVKKRERISDAGDVKESIYKLEKACAAAERMMH